MKRTAPLMLAALALLLTACGTPAPDATDASAPSATAEATPEPTPTTDAGAELRANIVDAMNSGNTAALEGYLAPSVHITYAASEYEGDVTDHALVIQNLTEFTGPGITWDFDLPAETIDDYANNPGHYPSYVDDFPEGALVGRSSDARVLSFAIDGDRITRILFCNDEFALTFE